MDDSTVRSYRELRVWNEVMTLTEKCYLMTPSFPKGELYGMTSQIRTSAASAPANIAEAYSRETRGECIPYLRVAQGSLKESETHLMLSQQIQHATSAVVVPVLDQCETVGEMLHALFRSLQKGRG